MRVEIVKFIMYAKCLFKINFIIVSCLQNVFLNKGISTEED